MLVGDGDDSDLEPEKIFKSGGYTNRADHHLVMFSDDSDSTTMPWAYTHPVGAQTPRHDCNRI